MKELYFGLIGFIFGILSHVVYGIINNSRTKKQVKSALRQEIQANFFQVRDGRNHVSSKKEELKDLGKGDPIVINDYKFSHAAFESNISNLSLLSEDVSMKIYHFYSRLTSLEKTAQIALKFFREAKEIKAKDRDLKLAKVIDSSALGSDFHQVLEEYAFFETQAYNIGSGLIDMLK